MDPPDCFDPSDFDSEFDEPFNVPAAVVELEVPTTSRAAENASPPLLIASRTPSPFKTPAPPSPAPSSTSSTSASACTAGEKRRRPYLPDPIRGTSQHTVKRQRNNAAVRKSRAKASETTQAQEELNTERRRQTELYRAARSNLTEMVRRFKQNIFERSGTAQAEQRELCQELRRINQELKDKGLEVPCLDET